MKINKKIEENHKSINLSSQEHLSKDILNSMSKNNIDINYDFNSPIGKNIRPQSSFLELMEWSLENFKPFLKDQENLNKYVHNRIVIDGLFLQFCKENNITVNCLHKDSIISWNMESNYEKFFIQGAFLIKKDNLEFLHFASWHKGNQNEDEISFFIIVSNKNYELYLELRNQFDAWLQKRDRSNLYIRVIDGDDIAYTKDNSWEDLFLTDDIKVELKNLVEGFLASKDFYEKNKIPWKRGVLLYGTPGCHAKGTPIMMANGSWKNVEDIKIGEHLMGPDSEPREVLKLVRGNEQMYKITPNKGKSFVVNGNHILHLKYPFSRKNLYQNINISVNDYLSLSEPIKQKFKLVKYLQSSDVTNNKNNAFIGIESVENVGADDYYGFTVDKDHLYVMDDFWVTHNCGKTSIIRTIMSQYNFKPVTIVPGANDDAIREAFAYAEEQSPSLLYFEDLDSMLERNDISSFLNLMDGISAKNGLLVIATANEVKKLKSNITDRPSRFDRKFQIPLPDQKMAYIYIKKWFGTSITTQKCKELSKIAEQYKFSYAYLKDLYISSMFEALSHNRKTPTIKDIENALIKLIKEKNVLSTDKSIKTDKYLK